MFSIWTLALVTGVYVLLLFAVAVFGNKIGRPSRSVYALALGIHCTSWAFFGTTTQALQFGWAVMPTYLGVILVMLFGYSALVKIAHICRQYKISSLAEFIGIRYHHSNLLAAIVVLLCFVGVIPYIALQLDAISSAITVMTGEDASDSSSISFYVTAFMALFAIWFGTNTLDLTKKRDGLMFTIAFESVLKLLGLFVVGFYCVYILSDGWIDLFDKSLAIKSTREILTQPSAYWVYASHILLGICSMFCLPRQFHINFVENNNEKELALARWVFPLYLLLMSLFILPIALTGQIMFDSANVNADNFVLSIPIAQNNHSITLIAFIGGLAASTSMVIVATLALGNMVANNLLTPLWLTSRNIRKGQPRLSARQLLRIRQGTIVVLIFIAYWYHQNISQETSLVKSGTIAIALMAQTLPAVLFAIYWSRAQKLPVLLGLVFGAAVVFKLMLYPAVLSSYYFAPAPSDNDFAFAIFFSLSCNTTIAILGSLIKQSSRSNPFANEFIMSPDLSVPMDKLSALMQRILPENAASDFIASLKQKNNEKDDIDTVITTPTPLLIQAERTLASHVGNASSRILLNAISDNKFQNTNELTELVEMATQSFQFNHEVLQSSIAHLPQGISVVDSQLNLVAWNRQYEALFEYPDEFLIQGLAVKDILEYNAHRGLILSSDIDTAKTAVNKRLSLMRKSKAYKYIRQHSQDKVIEIAGNPLPGGGYITSFTDITEYIQIQQQLEAAKADLEARVVLRTQELELAKRDAESANISKTKFLAATGHDLMQPFNAATLFASMLHEKLAKSELHDISSHLVQSLENADQLLSMLIEITKLETGKIVPSQTQFALDDILQSLANDFAIIGAQKGISLQYVKTNTWVNTDKRLLSRAIQNLLANAIRYTQQGKVLLGVRRRPHNKLEIMVVDTGPGIAKDNHSKIFNEFQRLDHPQEIQGLGLGLTIVERTAQLLAISVTLQSRLNKGTAFGLLINRLPKQLNKTPNINQKNASAKKAFLLDKRVLILENDHQIATALGTLINDWGAKVMFADSQESAMCVPHKPDLIIADYHLNNTDTGIDVCVALMKKHQYTPAMILSSADRSEHIQEQAIALHMKYLPKPIKSAALKKLIQTRLHL